MFSRPGWRWLLTAWHCSQVEPAARSLLNPGSVLEVAAADRENRHARPAVSVSLLVVDETAEKVVCSARAFRPV
jgi:hypothetical protein